MTNYYTSETMRKTAALIHERFHISDDRAQRMAVAALDGIESHGSDPENWETIVETVRVVVAAWVKNGAFE